MSNKSESVYRLESSDAPVAKAQIANIKESKFERFLQKVLRIFGRPDPGNTLPLKEAVKPGDIGGESFPVFDDDRVEEEFTLNGYVVRQFLSLDDIERLQELFDTELGNLEYDWYSNALLSDKDKIRRIYHGLKAIVEPRLNENSSSYRFGVGHFVLKSHHGIEKVELHQDYTVVDLDLHRGLQIFCPLVDTNEENGCLRIVPGSHKFTSLAGPQGNGTNYSHILRDLESEFTVSVPLKAGEIIFFDGRLLHGSGPNITDKKRIAISGVAIPRGVKPQLYIGDRGQSSMHDIVEMTDEKFEVYDVHSGFNKPYPEGVTLIGKLKNDYEPLCLSDIENLRTSKDA